MTKLPSSQGRLPSLELIGGFLGLANAEKVAASDQPIAGYEWLQDLKVGCIILTTLGVVAHTIIAIAGAIMTLLKGVFWISAVSCLLSLVANMYLLAYPLKETSKTEGKVQELANDFRNYLCKHVRFNI